MEVEAITRNVRMSPRKVRLVAAAVRGMTVGRAREQLPFLIKAAAKPILKTIQSAAANAANNLKLKTEDLKIKNILVDEGIRKKHWDKSHGARFGGGVRQKRASHIKVVLADK